MAENPQSEVSPTRLYLGNLPRTATKADVENHFAQHGTGEIVEIKLMNGFGFIEYKDAMDARDVVPAFHGGDFMGERLIVQFARGSRRNENFVPNERAAPRPRRTPYRMRISNLPVETSWQDLKDFARQSGLDVVYSEVGRERDGTGFVEYETHNDLKAAVEKLDRREFKGQEVSCVLEISDPPPPPPFKPRAPHGPGGDDRGRDRYRSRSPAGRRPYPQAPYDDYYDRGRGPPRGYSPRGGRDDYRRRTPPPRDYYDNRDRYARASPRRGGPPDDYPPPRPRFPEDPYDARGPPPRRGYEDSYANGHGGGVRPYDGARPPSPRGAGGGGGARPGFEEGGYPPRGRYW